jgi:surfactin synthase thioesterase subunit
MLQDTSWIAALRPVTQARQNLLCFPFSGAGATAYKPFVAHLPPDVGLYAVRLPGREQRFSEPAVSDVSVITDHVYAAASALFQESLLVFGHSMGTLLAYDLVRRIETSGETVTRLVVSARGAPHIPPSGVPIHKADRATVLSALHRLGGTPEAFFASPELQDLVLPTLRADFQISETYFLSEPRPVTSDIVALAGETDPLVHPENIDAWEAYTTGQFRCHHVTGGHFHIFDDPHRTLRCALDL